MYLIEHAVSEHRRMMDDRRYKTYVTDALMVISENTARMNGGRRLTKRWADKYIPKDTRTGDEIAADIIKHAGLIPIGQVK